MKNAGRTFLLSVAAAMFLCCANIDSHAQTASERARMLEPVFYEAGRRHNVDPCLLWTVGWIESRFRSGARSPAGAAGVMQFMPGTAPRFGVRDPLDPVQSIDGAARYLRFLLDLFDGNVALAMAGYNAGEGAVLKYGRRVPPYKETQDYVRNGLALLARVQASPLYRDYPRLRLASAAFVPLRVRRPVSPARAAAAPLSSPVNAPAPDPLTPESKVERDSFMFEVVSMDATESVDEAVPLDDVIASDKP